jgi:hypothetical protein
MPGMAVETAIIRRTLPLVTSNATCFERSSSTRRRPASLVPGWWASQSRRRVLSLAIPSRVRPSTFSNAVTA